MSIFSLVRACSGSQAESADIGSSHVELPIEYEGKTVEITFDPRYLIDALRTLDDTTSITAELIDSKNAAVFKTSDQIYVCGYAFNTRTRLRRSNWPSDMYADRLRDKIKCRLVKARLLPLFSCYAAGVRPARSSSRNGRPSFAKAAV